MSDSGLDRVTSLAREVADSSVSAEVHAAGQRRLLAAMPTAMTPEREPRGTGFRFAMAALVAGVLAATITVFWRNRPLRYEVTGSVGSGVSYVSAPANAVAEVHFSDGSNVVAVPGTRLRIEDTRRDGASVLVERGTTTAHVTHERRSSWLFVAGPFDVHVTGTKLTITWDPAKEEVDVTLHEGSVEIDSPVGPSRSSVRAGHRFHASVLEGTMKIEEIPTARPQTADGTAAPESRAPSSALPPSTTAAPTTESRLLAPSLATASPQVPGSAPPPREEAWSELVRRGAFDAVVAAAQERGLPGCLATCTASDVRALADAARYVGNGDIAKKSLLSLRSRFPGSKFGAAAGFLLGRTSESAGDLRDADRWYRTYLTESANGEFAADALAGRMRTSAALEGPAAAKTAAREYLKRYPDGVHASAARKLAGPD